MISALQHGKISIDLKEDTLTSSVFESLLALPNNLFWEILKNSCRTGKLPDYINYVEAEFWPTWNPDDTGNQRYVEPDLFLRFDSFDLIVEAKRWDGNQQRETQWRNEFIAYKNEFGKEGKPVFLLAVGVDSEKEEEIAVADCGTLVAVKCRWNNILDELLSTLNMLEKCRVLDTEHLIRNIKKVITCLELHGFVKIRWLSEITENETVIRYRFDFDNSFNAVKNWEVNPNG
jgi:hypothetical protein